MLERNTNFFQNEFQQNRIERGKYISAKGIETSKKIIHKFNTKVSYNVWNTFSINGYKLQQIKQSKSIN